MSAWNEEEVLVLDDADIVELHSQSDLFKPFPTELTTHPERTQPGTSRQMVHEAQTRAAGAWDVAPAVARADEVTGIRRREDEFVDVCVVVDSEGRLRPPEDVAKQLQPGAIVQVRIAAWAVPEGTK